MKTSIWITTSFEGYHCWPTAPEDVLFLRSLHRHVFHVRVQWATTSDRQLEFFQCKRLVNTYLREQYDGRLLGSLSCEAIATDLLTHLKAEMVSVSEDNENGAVVCLNL